jgi:hypothetical protein
MTQTYNDPFASTSAQSVSFNNMPVGTSYTGTVLELPQLVQARDFETGNPATWPDGNPKMTVVTKLSVDGEERSLWAPKPSAMFAAISDAQKTAGASIAVGGTLTVTYTGDKPNATNPRLNPAKQYSAVYTPPNAFGTDDQQVPSNAPTGQYAEPAPQQQPTAAPVTNGPTPEAIAALKAAGVDPATVYPGYTG